MSDTPLAGSPVIAEADHVEDLKRAAANMSGAERRAFQADMALKYCAGSPRRAEMLFGWGRRTVALGLHEKRTGIVCLDARPVFSGDKAPR